VKVEFGLQPPPEALFFKKVTLNNLMMDIERADSFDW